MIQRIIARTFITLLFAVFSLTASANEYMCREISLADGLSQSYVSSIARDGVGFLWIGTRFGLNRYDFDQIKNYYSNPADETTLPDNSIRKIFVDSHNHIFVACGRGTAIYQRYSDNFKRLVHPDGKQLNIRSFFEEDKGVLLGGAGELLFYDFHNDKIIKLQVSGGSSLYYTAIHPWMPGFYILSTRWDGLWLFDRSKASIKRLPGIENKGIMATFTDSSGRLWVSPYGEGICIYDLSCKLIKAINTSNSQLPHNIVLDMTEHDGSVWIGTDGGGLAVYDLATDSFVPDNNRSRVMQSGAVSSVFADKMGNMYGGTVRDGAFMIVPTAMSTVQLTGPEHVGTVTSTYVDTDGTLWLGNDGGGLFLNKAGTDRYESVASAQNLRITDVTALDEHRLLIATFNQGFFAYDKTSRLLGNGPAVLNDYFEKIKSRAFALRLRRLSNGSIAIISENIVIFNPAHNNITAVPHADGLIADDEILQPFYSENGRLLCFSRRRVTEYNPIAGKHITLFKLPVSEAILCAVFDGAQNVYLGTEKGVFIANLTDGTILPVQGTDGIRAHSLALDDKKRLWIGTTQALLLKLPASNNVTGFGLSDGVTPNEYLHNAIVCTHNHIFMGGVTGLLRINLDDVDDIISNYEDPKLNLADITLDGTSAFPLMNSDGVFVIPAKYSDLRMNIVDMGDNSMHSHAIRYYIYNGRSERIVEMPERTLNLNMLEEGNDYEIYASSYKPDGNWTPKQHLASLSINGLWWKTWWSITLLILVTLIIIVLWFRHIELKRSKKAEAKIEAYRNNSIERELAFLVNTNYALRTPLTLIYAPVKLLLQSIKEKHRPEDLEETLENVYRNTKRMRDTIDMALSLHNVSNAPDSSKLATHDINRSVEDAVVERKANAELKHVTLSYLPSQEMFPADYDRPWLAKVLDIFLNNAIQRSSEYSSIAVKTMKRDDFVRVAISDTGETPDESTLVDMFSKYFNDDNSNFSHSLEFAYAKNIVEVLGGHVGAEVNQDGAGLTVWLEIPAADSTAAEAYTTRRRSNLPASTATLPSVVCDVDTSQLTAIVVDEDSELCLFVHRELSRYFGQVYHAFNGNDALILIRQYQPDIVISSVLLPGKSGIELCRDIKSSVDLSHIPFIFLTSVSGENELESGYGVGADSYLTKPFDIAVLLMRCRNLLHNRSIIRARYADKPVTPTPGRLSNADESFIIKVEKIINDNLATDDFSVDTIVDAMALSRSAFYTRFKDITGQTIGQYITARRVEVAKNLLIHPTIPISEISERLGFSSQRYFSTFFKQQTGMSPSAYRKESKSE